MKSCESIAQKKGQDEDLYTSEFSNKTSAFHIIIREI